MKQKITSPATGRTGRLRGFATHARRERLRNEKHGRIDSGSQKPRKSCSVHWIYERKWARFDLWGNGPSELPPTQRSVDWIVGVMGRLSATFGRWRGEVQLDTPKIWDLVTIARFSLLATDRTDMRMWLALWWMKKRLLNEQNDPAHALCTSAYIQPTASAQIATTESRLTNSWRETCTCTSNAMCFHSH